LRFDVVLSQLVALRSFTQALLPPLAFSEIENFCSGNRCSKPTLISVSTSITAALISCVRQLRFDVVLIQLVALRSFTQALLLPESDRTAKVVRPAKPLAI